MLHTRKRNVKLITQNGVVEDILLTENDLEKGVEIEYLIVSKVQMKHDTFIDGKWTNNL